MVCIGQKAIKPFLRVLVWAELCQTNPQKAATMAVRLTAGEVSLRSIFIDFRVTQFFDQACMPLRRQMTGNLLPAVKTPLRWWRWQDQIDHGYFVFDANYIENARTCPQLFLK